VLGSLACATRAPEQTIVVAVQKEPNARESSSRTGDASGYDCAVEDFSQCLPLSHLSHRTLRDLVGTSENCLVSSDNGGVAWRRGACAAQIFGDARLDRVQSVSPSEVWLLTDLELYRSVDAGTNFSAASLPLAAIPRGFRFASAKVGFWVGEERGQETVEGVIYRTTDGGESWTKLRHPARFPYDWRFRDAWPVSESNVWVVGDTLLQSEDGGDSWNEVEADRSYRDVAIRFSSERVGWIARYPSEHYLLTVDGGQSWTARELPWPGGDSNELVFIDGLRGWAAAGETIRRTTDGGITWSEEHLCRAQRPDPGGSSPYLFAEYVAGSVVITGPCGRSILSLTSDQPNQGGSR
jgi:photosystem II stability/assembly factor-like uncharacterized protein